MLFEYKELETRIREELNLVGGYYKEKPLVIIDKRNTQYDFYIKSGMIYYVHYINVPDGTSRSFTHNRKSGPTPRYITRGFGHILMIDTIGSGKFQNESIDIYVFNESDRVNYLDQETMLSTLSEWSQEKLLKSKRIEI